MEITQAMINNRQKCVEFYDKLKSNLEKLQRASIKEVLTNESIGESEKEAIIRLIESHFREQIRNVEQEKNDYYDEISKYFKAIQQMDENKIDDDEFNMIHCAQKLCQDYKNEENNINQHILSDFARTCANIDAEIPQISDVYYEGANEIIDNMYSCRIDKSKAKSVPGHRISKYPVFTEHGHGRRLFDAEYEPIL